MESACRLGQSSTLVSNLAKKISDGFLSSRRSAKKLETRDRNLGSAAKMSRQDRPKRADDEPFVYGTFSPVYPPQPTISTSSVYPPPSPVPVYASPSPAPVYSSPSPAPTFPVYPPPSPVPTSHSDSVPPFYHNRPPTYHAIPVGYQSYGPVVEGIPLREHRLPCCGIGIGWFLFLAGFFFAAVPWYIGVFILLFVGVDYREKAGLIACTVGAVLVAITVILGLSHENLEW